MAAVAHAQEAAPVVGAEGNEQQQRALVGKVAGQFGELGIVADENADGTTVGVDDGDVIAALDVPPIGLRLGVGWILSWVWTAPSRRNT